MLLRASDHIQRESLNDEVSHILEEARMLLPGIQAIFGFQLIAAFNNAFRQELTHREQVLHLVALILVALAAALVITPAAYHRQAEPGMISTRFVRVSTKLLAVALVPLMVGIGLDIYLIARIVLNSVPWSLALSGCLMVVFGSLWFVFPWLSRRRPHS